MLFRPEKNVYCRYHWSWHDPEMVKLLLFAVSPGIIGQKLHVG